MHKDEAIFLLFVISLLGAISVVTISLMLRHKRALLLYQEWLTAMDKGIAIPPAPVPSKAPWSPRVYLLRGLVWLFSGLALGVFFVGISASTLRPMPFEDRLRQARWLREGGTPESEVQLYMQDSADHRSGLPYSWALIGLIPMGVGMAYLIVYRAEGHRMRNGG